MVSAQKDRGASDIAFTPTPTPRSMLLLLNEQKKMAFNGWRHTDKYIFVSMGVLSYSIHIQFFSQNQSIPSSI